MKKIGPKVTEEKMFKGVDRDRGKMDGMQVITIAYVEPCSGELIKRTTKSQVNLVSKQFIFKINI